MEDFWANGGMIYLGIGANLPSAQFGAPRATCGAALEHIERSGVSIVHRSPWYESAPVPVSDQPWYINGVVGITTSMPPDALMQLLLETEATLGRRRDVRNAPRIVDLDLLAYDDHVITPPPDDPLQLHVPHERMHERSFVIIPLFDISANWVHPKSGVDIATLKAALPAGQITRRLPDADGLCGTEWVGGETPVRPG